MAHYQQLSFVRAVGLAFPESFARCRVLEIGSWDANGSIRGLFTGCDYLGVDLAPGPGVDRVSKGEDVAEPDGSFDTALSCECFEHNPGWKATFLNMIRLLKPGGLCVVTCATLGRKEHGTRRTSPDDSLTALEGLHDYYSNLTPRDLREAVDLPAVFAQHAFWLNPFSRDLYFVGLKRGGPGRPGPSLRDRLDGAVKAIRREKSTNALQHLKYVVRFWLGYGLAALLGEARFHDLRYRLR